MKLVPTGEQVTAIDLVNVEQFVKLVAFAGCSKTTTLTMVAHQLNERSLYLAYNKAMADDAKGKFPEWVTVKTTHSQAFGLYGSQLASKLNRPSGGYVNVCGTGSEIARYFHAKPIMRKVAGVWVPFITAPGIGVAIKETVNSFEFSADREIEFKHISHTALRDKEASQISPEILKEYRRVVLNAAQKLWSLRTDPTSDILCTHDTYLKLYQLSNPDLSGYKIIYLDEGQDTNECVLDIIKRQVNSKIVVVGDPYQQIYQFRGSINAMQKLPYKMTGLSQSFRFGQEIADIANAILSCGGPKVNIRGWENVKSRVLESVDQSKLTFTYTILYRTNMALILDAVEYLEKGKKVNLEIDVKDFIKLLESALELKNGNKAGVKHESLLAYLDWGDFTAEVEGKSSDLSRIHKIIEENRHEKIITMLKTQKNVPKPDIIMTTAHKSKGREFDVVILASDFPSNYNQQGEWVGLNEAERNLLYVGSTRARRVLVTNRTVKEILNRLAGHSDASKVSAEFNDQMRKQIKELTKDMEFQG